MSKLTTTWWIIFYKDQLLLKKTDNGFSIPCAGQPPIHISPETNIHEICMLDGHPCKAIAIDYPVEESDKYMMTGLRASYDFIPLKQYQTAGKAAEILHWDRNSRFCPACGTAMEQKAPIMKKCPKCGNRKIRYLGWGTELIEKELKEDFPQARCQRFDLDSTSRKNSAQRILNDFKNDKIDILFGTQMVAKGHDIPNVNTVGILSADSILNMPTYLAAEQTFNLITQCAGRAGRGKERGEVILQTYNPEHYVIETAARQDYEKFYEQEVEFRKMLGYPPFLKLLKITCFNKDYNTAVNQANTIYRFLCEANKNLKAKVSFTEPFPEPIKRVRNLYFISILIKGSNFVDLKNLMRNSVIFKENDIIIDVDPI